MQIELDGQFKRHFQTILEHIDTDKVTASKNFKKELFKQIKNLSNFPFKATTLLKSFSFSLFTLLYFTVFAIA